MSIIPIGNSQGIRIPKPILDQCEFGKEVEIEVRNKKLIIQNPQRSRKHWAVAFQNMAQAGDDKGVACIETDWDTKEWEW